VQGVCHTAFGLMRNSIAFFLSGPLGLYKLPITPNVHASIYATLTVACPVVVQANV
jgi:hypothetical protein